MSRVILTRIIGPKMITVADDADDMTRNTDLITLGCGIVRIPCRIRRPGYLDRYRYEFTIRYWLPSGTKTEFEKLIAGWGDYFFYGYSDEAEHRLVAWMILDLKPFRVWVQRFPFVHQACFPGKRQVNGDGSSEFYAFDIRQMPQNVLIDTETSWR